MVRKHKKENAPASLEKDIHDPVESGTKAFSRGALMGGFQGAAMGALAWPVLFGAFGVAAGISGFLGVVAIGALVIGLVNGRVEANRANRHAERVQRHAAAHAGEMRAQAPTRNQDLSPAQREFMDYPDQGFDGGHVRRLEEERRARYGLHER